MKRFIAIAEIVFVIFGFTFFTGVGLFGGKPGAPALIPIVLATPLRYFVWGMAGLLLCLRWKRSLTVATQNPLLILLTVWVSCSFVWSENFALSLDKSREVWQMATFGFYLGTRFTLKQQLRLFSGSLLLGAILSILLAIGVPYIGIHQDEHVGAWKGIYVFKNALGSMMSLAAACFTLLPLQPIVKAVGVFLAMALMLLSTSKGALLLFFINLFLLYLYRSFRWKGKITVILIDLGLLVGGTVITVVLSQWVNLLTALGKDPTLTGRIPMWGSALQALMEKPLFGFGRGVFWAEGSYRALTAGRSVNYGYIPPNCHNGFIDLSLDNGFIGLGLFFLCFFVTYITALRRAYGSNRGEDSLPLAFLTLLLINNCTESYLLDLTNIYWVLFTAVSLAVHAPQPLPIPSRPALTPIAPVPEEEDSWRDPQLEPSGLPAPEAATSPNPFLPMFQAWSKSR
ncbi:MAG: O-antigen ligase family protein [Synechococcales bacterium]|nr:O-antigen ligase family protein [Synechococcales bacterium]